ncbi:pilus assembly protein [Microbulbifer bruguierae]|uniref:Pilus assembly protein n=1 Tax=Microbulbifer bruguierae TaxID=3029061 RepID=A0ABY8N9Z0_9GAMM|nr:pilus assembly protein [Microbulbifer bruguierae]WGL15417.1 pilus assembly protein [Microbulbifer bruguierae]
MLPFLRDQKGQALPEMLIVFPIVVILVMGIIQVSLLYRGKATLNSATFHAARAGALNHAYLSSMRSAFFHRMAALGHVADSRKTAITEEMYDDPDLISLTAMRTAVETSHLYDPVKLEWPTKAVFDHFAVRYRQLEACSGNNCPFSNFGGRFRVSNSSGVFQIPHENLDARINTVQTIDGGNVDLQDANLLRIRSMYCYDLEVPVANFIIWRTLRMSQSTDPDWQVCETLRQTYGNSKYLMPLRSYSVVRMQSGIRCEGDEQQGRNCQNLH